MYVSEFHAENFIFTIKTLVSSPIVKGGGRDLKKLLLLFLCLSTLTIFPVAISMVINPSIPAELSIDNTYHAAVNSGFELCGDEIETPGYPT